MRVTKQNARLNIAGIIARQVVLVIAALDVSRSPADELPLGVPQQAQAAPRAGQQRAGQLAGEAVQQAERGQQGRQRGGPAGGARPVHHAVHRLQAAVVVDAADVHAAELLVLYEQPFTITSCRGQALTPLLWKPSLARSPKGHYGMLTQA